MVSHFRFCPSLRLFQFALRGLSANCWAGVSSLHSGRVDVVVADFGAAGRAGALALGKGFCTPGGAEAPPAVAHVAIVNSSSTPANPMHSVLRNGTITISGLRIPGPSSIELDPGLP